jgi:hypothetical protein
MASRSEPRPSIVRLPLSVSGPLVKLMVSCPRLWSKTIVSPVCAAASVARKEPAPLSALFRTMSVLKTVRSSRIRSCGVLNRGGRDVRQALVALLRSSQ